MTWFLKRPHCGQYLRCHVGSVLKRYLLLRATVEVHWHARWLEATLGSRFFLLVFCAVFFYHTAKEKSSSWSSQAGIVSWGIGCGSDSPAVYARVAKASCWIDYEVIFETLGQDSRQRQWQTMTKCYAKVANVSFWIDYKMVFEIFDKHIKKTSALICDKWRCPGHWPAARWTLNFVLKVQEIKSNKQINQKKKFKRTVVGLTMGWSWLS